MTPDALISGLQEPWRHGEHLNARGAVFEEPVVLDGMTLRGFDFTGAHFKAGLCAKNAIFQGLAWFTDVRVDGECDLTSAQFRIDLRAEGLSTSHLCLDDARIWGVLALARLRARNLSLSRTLVLANLTLEDSVISEGIDMSQAMIMGGFWAKGARLGAQKAEGVEIDGRVLGPDG